MIQCHYLIKEMMIPNSILIASAQLTRQKAFGLEHQSQEKLNLLCVREAKDQLNCKIESKEPKDIQKAKGIESSKSSLSATISASNTNGAVPLYNQSGHTQTHEVLITVVLVSTFSFWLLLYTKQRKKRLAFMRQNIEALERLWKISNYH